MEDINSPLPFRVNPHDPPAPPSPCVRVCQLDEEGVCKGCGRTIDEISSWPFLSSIQKQEVVDAAKSRLSRAARRLPGSAI